MGAGGSASLAMARCAISTLHLPRTSFLDEFRLLSKKSGQFMCTTVTMVIMTPDHCAPKHKSPSTLARDAARSKKHKERLQFNNAAAAVHQPRPSAPRASRSIGFSSELPAPSSSISALSVPSGSPILPPIAAKRARLTLARSEAQSPSTGSFVFIPCFRGFGPSNEPQFYSYEGDNDFFYLRYAFWLYPGACCRTDLLDHRFFLFRSCHSSSTSLLFWASIAPHSSST